MVSHSLFMKDVISLVFLFVFMMSFVFAAPKSSIVQTDFYIPENVSDVVDDADVYNSTWVFWGVGVLIVILIVAIAFGLFRKKKVIVPVKKAKARVRKVKSSKKRKK